MADLYIIDIITIARVVIEWRVIIVGFFLRQGKFWKYKGRMTKVQKSVFVTALWAFTINLADLLGWLHPLVNVTMGGDLDSSSMEKVADGFKFFSVLFVYLVSRVAFSFSE